MITEHMDNWPARREGGRMKERQCPHGVWHPDPSTLAFVQEAMGANYRAEPHVCDGCCEPSANGDG